MFYRSITQIIRNVSSIKQSLKVLQLTVPTTKATIKKQYLFLAKKYHPDSADSIQQQQSIRAKIKNMNKKQNQQCQQKFVNVNRAYQYLKELSQQQINSNKQKLNEDTKGNPNGQTSEQRRAKMSTQQIKRQQTYQYFNNTKRYNPTNYQNAQNPHINVSGEVNKERKPLYKAVPQLFVGFLILALALGDWTYRIVKRKYSKGPSPNTQQIKQKQNKRVQNVFKRMSHNAVFNKNPQVEIIE